MSEKKHNTIYRRDYQSPRFFATELYLDFILNDTDCIVNAKTLYVRNSDTDDTGKDLQLNGQELELIEPTLSPVFTNILRDQFIGQTNLEMVERNGDLAIEGEIIN